MVEPGKGYGSRIVINSSLLLKKLHDPLRSCVSLLEQTEHKPGLPDGFIQQVNKGQKAYQRADGDAVGSD